MFRQQHKKDKEKPDTAAITFSKDRRSQKQCPPRQAEPWEAHQATKGWENIEGAGPAGSTKYQAPPTNRQDTAPRNEKRLTTRDWQRLGILKPRDSGKKWQIWWTQ